ncbi:AbrB/MazE/SpoVT family DNA-binding domain-containing protein [Micromonospora echinofusca]|uniref:AbrB/MazE/SpoVT family DNA-binding domain-containing protein n=1 Tax=Micromonospora echinofusca TaxID=47858 RepID=UPI00341AC068
MLLTGGDRVLHNERQVAGSSGRATGEDQLWVDRTGYPSVAAQGLPLPSLTRAVRTQAALCAVTSVDASGRLADRRPLQALGWLAGRTVEVTGREMAITVTARRDGRWKISRQGHLVLPSSVRRSCGIGPGHRLLVLAYPDRSLLLAWTMGVLELLLSRYVDEHEAA